MANFDRLAELGKGLFLQHDQKAIIEKYHLDADSTRIRLNYCGEPYEIDRETGDVIAADGAMAGPAETLAIFDMLCHSQKPVSLYREWKTTNTLPGGGQTSPDDVILTKRITAAFENQQEALREACRSMGGMPFPVGDVAWEIPVFDWFPAVFQFWMGDEEFPSSARFLWDRNTLQFLHYETLYYIMGTVLDRLQNKMNRNHCK